MPKPPPLPSSDEAYAMALQGLAFLAEDAPRLGRFLALTGIGPGDLRASADSPETLLAVLDHFATDESLLLVFAASKGIRPEALAPARAVIARTFGREAVGD